MTYAKDLSKAKVLHDAMIQLGEAARASMRELAAVSTDAKNRALREAAKAIRDAKPALQAPTRRI